MLFEVQTQRSGQNWITQSNWDNSADALREANNLVGSRRFRGVKVIKSRLDTNNMFRETTIFRHQHGERRRPSKRMPTTQFQDISPELARQTFRVDRRGGTLAWIICLGIATHAALGLLLYNRSGGDGGTATATPDKAVVYELPSVAAEAGAKGGVRATLRLEAKDKATIEKALPNIVNNLSRQIERSGSANLRKR